MPGARILVVDDEQLIRWSLRWHLEQAGFEILEAETGKEAIDRFDQGVDLALLDLRLPDTSGLSLLQRMKRRQPDCPVILITAHGGAEDAQRAVRAGAYRVLDKPFDFDGLVGLVREALDGAHAE